MWRTGYASIIATADLIEAVPEDAHGGASGVR
jgi:hypothetical protein